MPPRSLTLKEVVWLGISAACAMKTSDLCESDQQLLELIQDLKFGRIEHLQFRDGKPVVQPLP
jgi:hypothetical protein